MGTEQQSYNQERRPTERPTKPSLFWRLLTLPFRITGFLLFALVLAIVIEWLGMWFFWPELGVTHSQQMMLKEIGYLSDDFRGSLFASSPVEFARQFSDLFYHYLIEWPRLDKLILWLERTPSADARFHAHLHYGYQWARPYILSAVMVVQTFSLRLAILLLSLPCFVLFAAVGLADGLMRRDLRRWGGGRESSIAHHYAKSTMRPLLMAPWFLYLSWPVSVHPNLVILPCAALFGVSLLITSSTFKKYL